MNNIITNQPGLDLDHESDIEIIDTQAINMEINGIVETPDKLFKFLQRPCSRMLQLPEELKENFSGCLKNNWRAKASN